MNTFPLFGHPPARSVRWWMFDALVAVLVASLSLPYHLQEHVWPTPLTILVQVALTVPLVVRRIWPSAVLSGGTRCLPICVRSSQFISISEIGI